MVDLVDHGQMEFVEIDAFGWHVSKCAQCRRRIGLHPQHGSRTEVQGNFHAMHQASLSDTLTPEIWQALYGEMPLEMPGPVTMGASVALDQG